MLKKIKTVIKSLAKGLKKGWVTSTLPEYITKFNNKPIVRLFRFLGGLSVIITLGKVNFSFDFPIYIFYISFFITILFFVYMLVINIIRLIHIIKILRSDELDVRNSPLDKMASFTARILFFGKGIKAKNNMVINIISYIFLGFIIYLFMWDLKLVDTFQIFIFSIISFAISMFIYDNFKLSNNKFIKILQKFVFINSILVIIGLILYLLLDISIEKEISVPESSLLEIGQKLDKSDEFCNKIKKILDNGPEKVDLEFYPKVYKASEKCFEAQQEVAKFVDKLIESLNNKFVPDFNYLYDYLNSLNLLELSALLHLIVLSLICLITINIISAVLGNEIINFFKLEKKFPKLSSFLKIRLKFQKYYLILNFSLLFIICIVTIVLDILVLI